MLRYPEVYTDLTFVSISTLPLELRCSKKISTDIVDALEDDEDGFYTTSVSSHSRDNKNGLHNWRKHSMNEKILMDDLKQSGMGYDKITQFSLRPCKLKSIIELVTITVGFY